MPFINVPLFTLHKPSWTASVEWSSFLYIRVFFADSCWNWKKENVVCDSKENKTFALTANVFICRTTGGKSDVMQEWVGKKRSAI